MSQTRTDPGEEPVGVLVVGAHGHGRSHLRNIRRLSEAGAVRLVGICDTQPPAGEPAALADGVPWSGDLDGLLGRTKPEVVIICTPIQTHVPIAEVALRAGADLLLEKPPAPSLAAYHRLAEQVAASGRACQVGFQSFGSHAVGALRDLIAAGTLGELRGIGAVGAWTRDESYWTRATWAGRRRLDDQPVCDGALTNPFAHATAVALRIDGSDRPGDLASVEVELYRASPIEADDTSCLRVRTRRGTTLAVGVTLCAAANREPHVVVHGTRGRAVYSYTRNHLRMTGPDGTNTGADYAGDDLLVDLVRHVRDRSRPLIAPLERTGAFMEVLEAVRTAPDPVEIDPSHRQAVPVAQGQRGGGESCRHVVPGVESVVTDVAERLLLFSELRPPWARHATRAGSMPEEREL
jgi:predicted dehydrogenase